MAKSKNKSVSAANLTNPNKLNKKLLAQISMEFLPLESLSAELASAVVRYLVDGGANSVLLELAGKPEAAAKLGIQAPGIQLGWSETRGFFHTRSELLILVRTSDKEVLQRLGEIYAAIRQPHAAFPSTSLLKDWPHWLRALIAELTLTHDREHSTQWSLSLVESLLQLANLPSDAMVSAGLDREFQSHVSPGWGIHDWHKSLTDWGPYYSKYPETVRSILLASNTEARIFALDTLSLAGFSFQPLIDTLARMATDSAKSVRDTATRILNALVTANADNLPLIRDLAEQILSSGDASRRNEAVHVLWKLCGPSIKDRLLQHAAGEKSEKIKQTIERIVELPVTDDTDPSSADAQADLVAVDVPTGHLPLPEDVKSDLRKYLGKRYEDSFKEYQRAMERYNAADPKGHHYKPSEPQKIPESVLQQFFNYVEGNGKKPDPSQLRGYLWNLKLPDSWEPPAVQLVHILRALSAIEAIQIRSKDETFWMQSMEVLDGYRARCKPAFGLREVDAVIASLPEGKSGYLAHTYLSGNNSYRSTFDWEPEAVWPYFLEHRGALLAALGPSPNRGRDYSNYDYSFSDRRKNTFRVLAMFPRLPQEFIAPLWDLALGDSKTDRLPAQVALSSVPGKTELIIKMLKNGKQETRSAAADWLGRIGDTQAIEPLKECFRAESNEYAKGVIMTALEALGADVEEFMDRKKLLKEAETGLARKRPKGLDWFPFSSLPELRWADSNKPVAQPIKEWWIIQTVQQKSPSCGPLLRRYLGMCKPSDAAALAKFVLTSWIAQDTRHPTQEEAAAIAAKDADRQWQQYGTQPWFLLYNKDRDSVYRTVYQQVIEQFLGSAIGEKGMLALVSAVGDGDCVKICEQYVRKFFGNRLAQCKALIEVLAWMKHPLAIQVLLSIGNRFRTKALRQAANDYVTALAEREGWTIDELADRTIPDAGFARAEDEAGQPTGTVAELVLDYGPRKFVVRLDDQLEPIIVREDGKPVKAPPAPAKSDDAELAKAAKKTFADAKKLVKEVVKRQSERLYEAVCTQRGWRFDDWLRFLSQHPIMSKVCTRVIWSAFRPATDSEPESFVTNFRPLEDGSLTNEHDDTVEGHTEWIIRVAHECNTPKESRQLWQQHLQDYDVQPVFQQFGRAIFELSKEQQESTTIDDFVGHMLTTFQLRGKGDKLGWLRGDTEDAGCFYFYRKPFPSLQLQAVLEFSGSYVPESDMPAALKSLSFEAIKNDKESANSWNRSALPLKKIPPVLLSECYNDVKQIAAEGTGFDPKWESKAFY